MIQIKTKTYVLYDNACKSSLYNDMTSILTHMNIILRDSGVAVKNAITSSGEISLHCENCLVTLIANEKSKAVSLTISGIEDDNKIIKAILELFKPNRYYQNIIEDSDGDYHVLIKHYKGSDNGKFEEIKDEYNLEELEKAIDKSNKKKSSSKKSIEAKDNKDSKEPPK